MSESLNSPVKPSQFKRLWWAFWLNFIFMAVEAIGGVVTGSMALLSDAGHMLTDVSAIGLALIVAKLAQKPKDSKRTYGYLRAEIIGALLNSLTLILLCAYILYEAYHRLGIPQNIPGMPVLIIATVGFVINIGSAKILHGGQKDNLNMKGAYLHMLADALGSIGAMFAGGMILLTGWWQADTFASIFIAILILWGGWKLLKESIDILMEGTPAEINYQELAQALKSREHILDVHDLHIWTISS
ncbi:cation diffusion facilitator family transporter, partial [Candidatus Neomarinimicrobiota bacterium]